MIFRKDDIYPVIYQDKPATYVASCRLRQIFSAFLAAYGCSKSVRLFRS
ncbi:hypothetical protein ACFSPU_05920 [Haoranjiania flava]|uniref:Uncharacterized protein n=1 Tax=Haoranjiania flava TaxID=1856322 RepID=A0AAE3IQH8_9BACT|nr:hypothetical protein [Haoranjiania flava]MCU7695301.1 hypothetical protein [Haoranjiania flava]